MTSRPLGQQECFVYVTLPGETKAVTAGRYVRETNRQGVTTGRFVYGRSYLARPQAVEIDPVELKLGARTYETALMKGLFGALRDAGPDYWGRRVIEKRAGLTELGELDYLLHSPDDRAGALGFGLGQTPPAPVHTFNRTLDLARLQEIADRLVKGEAHPTNTEATQVEDLLLLGTSMGGARPKAVVEDADGLWLAKFNRADDKWNMARVEHAMLLLASAPPDDPPVDAGRAEALLSRGCAAGASAPGRLLGPGHGDGEGLLHIHGCCGCHRHQHQPRVFRNQPRWFRCAGPAVRGLGEGSPWR